MNRLSAAGLAFICTLVVGVFTGVAPASASSTGHPKDAHCSRAALVSSPYGTRQVYTCIRLTLFRKGSTNYAHSTVQTGVSGYKKYTGIPVKVVSVDSVRSTDAGGHSTTASLGTKTGTSYDKLGKVEADLNATKDLRSHYRMYAVAKVTLKWPSGYTKTVKLTSPGGRVGY